MPTVAPSTGLSRANQPRVTKEQVADAASYLGDTRRPRYRYAPHFQLPDRLSKTLQVTLRPVRKDLGLDRVVADVGRLR